MLRTTFDLQLGFEDSPGDVNNSYQLKQEFFPSSNLDYHMAILVPVRDQLQYPNSNQIKPHQLVTFSAVQI